RHPLPFTDVVGQSPTQTELAQDIVQHPVRVISRVQAANCGEAIVNVSLRLARHWNLTNTPDRRNGGWRDDDGTLGPAVPVGEEFTHTIDRLCRVHVAN